MDIIYLMVNVLNVILIVKNVQSQIIIVLLVKKDIILVQVILVFNVPVHVKNVLMQIHVVNVSVDISYSQMNVINVI